MTIFCPDGYVWTPEAVYRAAVCWFPEQMAAVERATRLQSKKPNNYVEAAWLALSSPEPHELQREFQDILKQTVDRLRSLLHQGTLNACYFENLGCVSVSRHFWATTDANGVMELGIYRPLSQLPLCYGFALLLLQSQLDRLLSDQPLKKRRFSESKMPELVNALGKLDCLPNRRAQFQALCDMPEFREFKITHALFRQAATHKPRDAGRKSQRQS